MLFYTSRFLFTYLLCVFFAGLNFFPLTAADGKGILLDWEHVPALFRTSYAPLAWKKQHLGWDLDTVDEEMRQQLFKEGLPSMATYRKTLRYFLASLHDYHVFPVFYSSEQASLPFSVMSAEGKYWIAWINRLQLPENFFRFEEGDELLLFDGKPVQECIDKILTECFAGGRSLTERLLAECTLTSRAGIRGDDVPQGLISITVRSAKTGAISEYQVVWEYEEDVLPPSHLAKGGNPPTPLKRKLPFLDTLMMVDLPALRMKSDVCDLKNNPWEIGQKESFFPPLAEAKAYEEGREEDFPFYAYTFKHPETGKTIGFVRIPHYKGEEEEAHAFGALIEYMEQNTSALVIDQLNNPGGGAYYLCALASFLSPEPLDTPKHQFILTHKRVVQAYLGLQTLKGIHTNETAQELFQAIAEEGTFGYPITYQTLMMLRHHYATLVKSWKQGKTLTPPMHIGGIDRIFPHPDFLPYSKPILLLINGLDFSGGDFMAAILSDSKLNGKPRATLFGQRTAGAGGAVEMYKYINEYGVAKIAHTVSIACRHGFPEATCRIENLGVSPDIPYTFTQFDIQNHWAGYRQAILDALVPMTASEDAEEDLDEEDENEDEDLDEKDEKEDEDFDEEDENENEDEESEE